MSFRPLALKKIKPSKVLLRLNSCAKTRGGSRGLSKPCREREDGSESAKPLIGMHNTPVKKAWLSPFLQMGNYFRCDFFHLLTTLISRRRKAEWTAVASLLERKTNKGLRENTLQEEHSTCHFSISVSEVTSSMAAIYPESPGGDGKEGSQHIKNLQLLLSIYVL